MRERRTRWQVAGGATSQEVSPPFLLQAHSQFLYKVQRRAWSFGAPWLVVVNCGFFWTVHTVRVDIQLGERWPCILLKSFWHGPVQAWVIASTCLNAGPLSIQCRCLICRLSLPKGASPISSPTAVSRNKIKPEPPRSTRNALPDGLIAIGITCTESTRHEMGDSSRST